MQNVLLAQGPQTSFILLIYFNMLVWLYRPGLHEMSVTYFG